MDSVRGALVQGLNTIRADNNKKLDEIRGTVEEKLQDTLQQRINDSFKRSVPSLSRSTRVWARCRIWPPTWAA